MPINLIILLVKIILKNAGKPLIRTFGDALLDFVEEHVEGTKSPIDDLIVLPICEQIREAFDIEDGID